MDCHGNHGRQSIHHQIGPPPRMESWRMHMRGRAQTRSHPGELNVLHTWGWSRVARQQTVVPFSTQSYIHAGVVCAPLLVGPLSPWNPLDRSSPGFYCRDFRSQQPSRREARSAIIRESTDRPFHAYRMPAHVLLTYKTCPHHSRLVGCAIPSRQVLFGTRLN